MSKTTIGEIVSRLRGQVKAVRQDAFLTDRFIFSFVSKHLSWLLKREDGANKMLSFQSIYRPVMFELEETDKIEAGCLGLQSGCTIRRTCKSVAVFHEGYTGPLILDVSSADGSIQLQKTDPITYTRIASSKNYKYNKTAYYWYLNDRLYFPEVEWQYVRVVGAVSEDISGDCIPRQDQVLDIPPHLLGELESHAFNDLAQRLGIPGDSAHDNNNPNR